MGDTETTGLVGSSTGEVESTGVSLECGDGIVTPGQMCFGPPVPFGSGHFFEARAVDLDTDGHQDVVMLDLDDALLWRMGHGDGTFGPVHGLSTGEGPAALVVTESDGDKYPEIVVPVQLEDDFRVYSYDPGGEDLKLAGAYNTGLYPTGAAAGDFDEDGLSDVIIASGYTGYFNVYRGTGDGYGPPESMVQINDDAGVAFVDDLNDDKNLDVVVFSSSGYADVLMGDGYLAFDFSTFQFPTPECSYGGVVVLVDITADEVSDIVWVAGDALCVRSGDGSGGFGEAVTHSTSFAEPATGFVVGDFTSDGVPDAVVVGDPDKSVLMRGAGEGFEIVELVGVPGEGVFSGDFNEDGLPDLLIRQGYSAASVMLSDP